MAMDTLVSHPGHLALAASRGVGRMQIQASRVALGPVAEAVERQTTATLAPAGAVAMDWW